ncbi:MAG: 5-formyltetrahydrofolate cyclo-ligase [bacterium]|nr:5-formyltetrahydrofolate cyclo-ligase [bacterium]
MSANFDAGDVTVSKAEARTFARQVWRDARDATPEILERITSHWREFASASRFRDARILIYIPLPDEIDLLSTFADHDPARIFAPCTQADHRMEFRQFAPAVDQAVPGFMSVPGPPPDAPLLELPLREDDLVVIPALGANGQGFRLGRGGGYYDRWRERLAPARRIGLLPKKLINLTFSGEAHDIQFNWIITEDAPFEI